MRKQKILIVDDDQNLLRMLRRTLVYEGFEVITGTNGSEALDAVHSEQPDLLILDWMMSKMDGLSVVETLRSVDNPIPIIIPCHRVIGSNQKLTGYRGGLPLKKHLLELERRHAGI